MKEEVPPEGEVAICGEVGSGNLGDGLIAHSLAHLVRTVGGKQAQLVDLTNRRGKGETGPTGPIRAIHSFLSSRSPVYRRSINELRWRARQAKGHRLRWERQLKSCNSVIVGGGQLLLDNGLAFPLRVNELVRLATKFGKPVAFLACGVGDNWSRRARKLFMLSLSSPAVARVSVRDARSQSALIGYLPQLGGRVRVDPDPAVLCGEALNVQAKPAVDVGVGISAPSSLRFNLRLGTAFDDESLSLFWIDLLAELQSRGHGFSIFTNGAVADHEFAKFVAKRALDSGKVRDALVLDRPISPFEFLTQVSRFRTLISHRLHANIAAFALGIPSVGLEWDWKVKQFLTEIRRKGLCLSHEHAPKMVADGLDEARRIGVDAAIRTDLQLHAKEAIRDTLAALEH